MKKALWTAACATLIAASPALAQRPVGIQGIGPRFGVTINPDQVHVGGQIDMGDLAPQLALMPNLEVGFGNHVTTVAPMFEVDYRFRENWNSWNPYVGGGIGPVFYSYSNGGDNTELGIAIQGGIARHMSRASGFFFMEFKLGLVDYPDAKFTLGWSFGSNSRGRNTP